MGIAGFITYWRLSQKLLKDLKALETKTAEELVEICGNPKRTLFHTRALTALKNRGVNIDFAYPLLLRDLLDEQSTIRIMAWHFLREHFPDRLTTLEFRPAMPSRESKEIVKAELSKTLDKKAET